MNKNTQIKSNKSNPNETCPMYNPVPLKFIKINIDGGSRTAG